MDEVKDFDIDFVKRTKEILGAYDGPYDMSIILNCLMGLLILPFERIKTKPDFYWDTELVHIPTLPSFQTHLFQPIEKINKGEVTLYPQTLRVLLRKIRNGIVHCHIEAINKGGKFASVAIRNYYKPDKKKTMDMHVEFSQNELRDFAMFIAGEYLKQA